MIEILFEFSSEAIIVVIKGNDVKFGNTAYGAQLADISGMKLDYEGVIREFPDLEDRADWQEEAALRFKDHIQKLDSEEQVYNYILKELEGYGYIAKTKKRKGFRPVNLR